VGGDLYDFFVRPDGKLLIVAGDVTGKGMGASLLMSSFLASIRVLYDACDTVGDLAQRLNAILYRSTDATHFVTGFIGCLDPATGEMQYVNGGHPLPMLVVDGQLRMLDSNAPPFGVLPMFPYVTASVLLHPGELMAIYSDGVSEAEHAKEFFGEEGLQKALSEITVDHPKDVRAEVVSRILAFVGDEPRADDITLILVRRDR
jgi:sigma-B regulation protein RsbU (phosphoserine phosphatase)